MLCKANNKYMKDQYKPDGTITYLQYLDADSLSIYDKTDQLVKKKERVYFRSWCRVSLRATQGA